MVSGRSVARAARVSVTFASGVTPEDKARVLASVAKIATERRSAPRRRVKSREAAGERALAATLPDAGDRPCIVRITYRSMGDEMLACDSEPMTPVAARRMAREINGRGRGRTRTAVVESSAEVFPVDGIKSLARGVRLVVFPSQIRTNAPQIDEVAA